MLGYLAAEAADWWHIAERETIQRRLKVACPWIIATAACTLLNPWGPRIYSGIATQEHISKLQSAIIVELVPLYRDFTWRELNPLAPLSAIWWLLAISAISIALLVYQKRVGARFVSWACFRILPVVGADTGRLCSYCLPRRGRCAKRSKT